MNVQEIKLQVGYNVTFQAYKEAQEDNRVVPGTNTPTRNNGIVGRAMEYMFGW